MESETADSEFKLNNATQRLLKLEQDVSLLRENVQNTSLSVEQTQQDAKNITRMAEKIKKVCGRVCSLLRRRSTALYKQSYDHIVSFCTVYEAFLEQISFFSVRFVYAKKASDWNAFKGSSSVYTVLSLSLSHFVIQNLHCMIITII